MDRYLQHPSLTARWSGTGLVPDGEAIAADETVWLVLSPNDDVRTWEGLRAERVSADTVRIGSVPAYVRNVHFGDEVTVVESAEGALVVTGLGVRSDNWTYRIWLSGTDEDAWKLVAEAYAQLGCLVDVLTPRLMALSCSSSLAATVVARLRSDTANGLLVYETGHTSDGP